MELNDRFYKSTEVSDILGVSLRTLYRYMDSGKIQSVQLPSGRHRFTKQQVESFLYSNGSGGLGQSVSNQEYKNNSDRVYVDTGYSQNQNFNQSQNQNQNQGQSTASQMPSNPYQSQQNPYSAPQGQQVPQSYANPQIDQSQEHNSSPFSSSVPASPQSNINVNPSTTNDDEPDDLDAELEELLASLEGDSNDSVDSESEQPSTIVTEPVSKSDDGQSRSDSLLGGLGGFDEEDTSATESLSSNIDENSVTYFYCPYNQLRAIARLVKTTSEDNDKKYAFTMNAGLSLYFPLDPFSVIHFYIEENDLEFWKDNLQLKESIKTDANIGLLLTKGRALSNAKEVSGLKVVSKEIMIENLKTNGLENLISQVESKL